MDHDESAPETRGDDGELLAAAWTELERGLAKESGPLGALRRAPRWVRLCVALGAGLLVPAMMALAMPRSDLGDVSAVGAVCLLAITLLIAGLGGLLATRPLQIPAITAGRVALFGAAASAALVALSVFPLAHDPSSVGATSHGAVICGGTSLAAALMVLAVAHATRRGAPAEAVGAAGLGAASAFASMALVCPIDEVIHTLLGHGVPLATLVALASLRFAWPMLRAA